MTRDPLEHIIRAAGTIADDQDIIVIGSQAILGQFPDADPELLISREADVYPRNYPERWNVIDGAIGEASPFDRQFGYYAHGVDETTATLPRGWNQRLVEVSGPNTRFIRGWCLEVHDLAIAKLAAGRDKALDFVRILASRGYVRQEVLRRRCDETQLPGALRPIVEGRIRAAFLV